MLQHGADIEAVDDEFNTSLHLAAKIGQFEVSKGPPNLIKETSQVK